MKRRSAAPLPVNHVAGDPNDLLVCFPSRARLALMPKPICSPSRPTDPSKRPHSRPTNRPLFRSKTTNTSSAAADDITNEPTSPKVTCAGQIRVRPKSKPTSSTNSRGWLSMVQEIERLHRQKKKPLMQFLGLLRSFRLDLSCFGPFHGAADDGTEEEEEEEEEDGKKEETKTIFSKWFTVLEEKQGTEAEEEEMEKEEEEVVAPPPNALLLMRSQSAPAKGEGRAVVRRREVDLMVENEKEKEKEMMLLMSHATDIFKVSTEIAKETWVVGNFDPLGRSRSCKR